MGAATAYQLAKSGVRVLGIDRYDPPHSFGSSYGDTRITRELYNYGLQVDLVRRSNQIWREIEVEAEVKLHTMTSGVFIGNPSGDDNAWITGLSTEGRLHNIEHETLSPAQLSAKFPAFRLQGDEPGLFEPGAGVLRPEACIKSQLRLASRLGAELHANERVTSIAESSGCVSVHTNHSVYEADRVVITAGPWINCFLSSFLASNIHAYRQAVYWFDIEEGSIDTLEPPNFPIFVWQVGSDSHQMFFGFPALDGPSGGLKIATEQYEVVANPEEMDTSVSDLEAETMYRDFASRIKGLSRRVVKASTCIYTVTRDWEYVLDWAPESDRVFVASACMGRGFKHSTAIGEAIAQTISSGNSEIDLSAFRISNRFAAS